MSRAGSPDEPGDGGAHRVTVSGLVRVRGGRRTLDGVDADVPRGGFTAVVGPSGCGKSTLLRILAGLEDPDAGRVSVFGQSPARAAARKAVGVVPQDPALLPWLSVEDNVTLPLRVNRAGERARAAAGAPQRPDPGELLATVGLADVARARPHELSGGMRQRVAVARAFALAPELLLLDEPFSAVDELTREQLQVELGALWRRWRTTVVLVTHSLREAVALADTVVVLSPGPARVIGVVGVARVDGDESRHRHEAEAQVRAHLLASA